MFDKLMQSVKEDVAEENEKEAFHDIMKGETEDVYIESAIQTDMEAVIIDEDELIEDDSDRAMNDDDFEDDLI